jgi:predicted transcriptional regulator
MQEQPRQWDGNIENDFRTKLKQIFKADKTLNNSNVGKASGVNYQTVKRFLEGETITTKTLDKFGDWITENNL